MYNNKLNKKINKCIMYLPVELQQHINSFAKPLTRPDWREGCYFNRNLEYFEKELQYSILFNELYTNLTYPEYLIIQLSFIRFQLHLL